MTLSKDILSYIEASSRWGAGMPARSAIAKGLGIRAKNVDSRGQEAGREGEACLRRSRPYDRHDMLVDALTACAAWIADNAPSEKQFVARLERLLVDAGAPGISEMPKTEASNV